MRKPPNTGAESTTPATSDTGTTGTSAGTTNVGLDTTASTTSYTTTTATGGGEQMYRDKGQTRKMHYETTSTATPFTLHGSSYENTAGTTSVVSDDGTYDLTVLSQAPSPIQCPQPALPVPVQRLLAPREGQVARMERHDEQLDESSILTTTTISYESVADYDSHDAEHRHQQQYASSQARSSTTNYTTGSAAAPPPPSSAASSEVQHNGNNKPGKNQPKTNQLNSLEAPILTPLVLRVNPKQVAKVVRPDCSKAATPVSVVLRTVALERQSGRHRLVPSWESPLFCVRNVPAARSHLSELTFVIRSPILNVIPYTAPTRQKIVKGTMGRVLQRAQLLLPPEGPVHSQVLRPFWRTVTFTIAYGKHVAIDYAIAATPIQQIDEIKIAKLTANKTDAKKLYRTEKEQKVDIWKAPPAQQLRLTTVEKCDPLFVKHVRVEQNACRRGANGEKMRVMKTLSGCTIIEMDMETTEIVERHVHRNKAQPPTSAAAGSGGAPQAAEPRQQPAGGPQQGASNVEYKRHRYQEHQIISRWEDKAIIENRRRRLE